MAERRMFAKTIIDSDAFLDMPITARLLYYDLAMRADDDGFVNSPKKIMKIIGASDDDIRILAARKFIIPFENGVVVIKHWRIHNYIRKDTYKETTYKEEKALLEFDENNAYTFSEDVRGRAVDEPWTQVRLGKDRLGEDRIGEDSVEEIITAPIPPTYGTHKLVTLTDAELEGLVNTYGKATTEDYIQQLDAYMFKSHKQYPSHYQTIIRWIEIAKREGTYHKPKKSTFNNLEQRQETDYDRQAYDLAKAQREAWKKKKGEQDESRNQDK